jgi:hypothetical protein
MDKRLGDPFPTQTINVPGLSRMLERLRSEDKRSITVLHATSAAQADWILSMTAARLARRNSKVVGPESGKPVDLVEKAIRIHAEIAFLGELRREEDANAARAAASYGIRTVAFCVHEKAKQAEALLTLFGPWAGYNFAMISASDSAPPRR